MADGARKGSAGLPVDDYIEEGGDRVDLPALFAIARPRIEAAARAKLSARSSPPLGVLHIWEEDILDPSPGASPRAMEASMRRG